MNSENGKGPLQTIKNLMDEGNLSGIEHIIRTTPALLESRDENNSTALEHAIVHQRVEAVALLITLGSDINVPLGNGYTYLHLAIEMGQKRGLEIVRILLTNGADIQARGINDWTPLHHAASRGFTNIAKMLIHCGADVNCRTHADEQNTPLMEAAYNGNTDVVTLLLENGARWELHNLMDQTAQEIAIERGFNEVVELLEKWKAQEKS